MCCASRRRACVIALVDCDAMVEVAEELEAPASGELGWIKIADLPTDLGQAVLSLPIGQVSAPLQGPGGIHLLMVCDRREPEQLSPGAEKRSRNALEARAGRAVGATLSARFAQGGVRRRAHLRRQPLSAPETGSPTDGGTEPEPLGKLIKRFQLQANKRLGQHFLLDTNLLARIVAATGELAGRTVDRSRSRALAG